MNVASKIVDSFIYSSSMHTLINSIFKNLSVRDTLINRIGFAVLVTFTAAYCANRFLLGAKKFNPLKGPWLFTARKGAFDANNSGIGKKISPLGSIWKGTFVNDKLHGQGKCSDGWADAKGQFENDQLVNGTITEPGRVSSGRFENGHLINGTLTESWKKHLFFGERVYTWTYTGEFQNGLLHGQGRKFDQYGHVEEGTFEQGRLIRRQVG